MAYNCRRKTYQSLSGAVESVSVVATELGVGSFQGRVTVGLGLLDTVGRAKIVGLVVLFQVMRIMHVGFEQKRKQKLVFLLCEGKKKDGG